MTLYSLSLIIFGLLLFLKVFLDTRDACFFSPNRTTDNEKMASMAEEISLFNWPSRMHSLPYGRGQLREFWVLGLHLISKILPGKRTDHWNIILGLIAHILSSVLIFEIAKVFVTEQIGFFIALLYLTTIWGMQVVIYIGHVILSQFFFLVSFYLLALFFKSELNDIWLLPIAGFFSVVSFSSSSASRKFPIMLVFLFGMMQKDLVNWNYNETKFYFGISLVILSTLILMLRVFISRQIVRVLDRVLNMHWPQERIIYQQEQMRFWLMKFVIWTSSAVLFCLFFVENSDFYLNLALFSAGFGLAFLLVLLPNVMLNLIRYYDYLGIGKWANHFTAYPDQVTTFGRKLPKNFRGEGIYWVWKFFWDVIPVPFFFYLIGISYGLYLYPVAESLPVFFLSILPTAISEMTKSLQVGKSYFPSFIGILIFLGWFLNKVGLQDWMYLILLVNFALFVYYYFTDVLPSRMSPAILRKKLKNLGVKEFYTYENSFNDSLVKTMEYQFPDEFIINYVGKISEILEWEKKEIFFVIPSTSSKGVQMETQQFSIRNGDFRMDEELNDILDHPKELAKCILASIKTMASSKFYVHESEITSFRHLGLKQVSSQDRWLGFARIIKLNP